MARKEFTITLNVSIDVEEWTEVHRNDVFKDDDVVGSLTWSIQETTRDFFRRQDAGASLDRITAHDAEYEGGKLPVYDMEL